ncbi:MAG: monophosphatase [Frankiales bacterium]|nr:monophosphatase [Frankiales bacterium]
MTAPDPHELLTLAVEVATSAGELLLTERPAGSIETGSKTSPTDLVTVMDTRVEAHIADRLRADRPHDGFLGEEGGAQVGDSGVRWIVDPIDGTVNYRYRLPHWSVSIAAEVDGVVVAGVVVDPSLGETWTAVRGEGARCNDAPVACTTESRLEQALVGTGFGYAAALRARQAEVLRTVLPRVRDIRRVGSCAIDLCWVAAGRLDAYYELGPQVWDYSAGGLICEEAGASFEVRPGKPDPPALVIAASPALFTPLQQLVEG